jgi:hypothetical protein
MDEKKVLPDENSRLCLQLLDTGTQRVLWQRFLESPSRRMGTVGNDFLSDGRRLDWYGLRDGWVITMSPDSSS